MKPIIIFLVASLDIFIVVYFMYNVIKSYQNDPISVSTLIFWHILFLIYLIYVFYGLFGVVFYLIMICKYFQVRQKSIQNDFINFNQHLKLSKYSTGSIWKIYNHLNKRTIQICNEINEYSRYCQPILSTLIPFYISIQCYLLYIVAVSRNISFEQRILFLFDIVEINLFLFFIIDHCAKVANFNRRI